MIGWRLNASSMDWLLVDESQALQDGKAQSILCNLYQSSGPDPASQGHLFDFEAQSTPPVDSPDTSCWSSASVTPKKTARTGWTALPMKPTGALASNVLLAHHGVGRGLGLNTVYLRNVPPTRPTTPSAVVGRGLQGSRHW